MRVMVCYDVSETRRRTRLARLLSRSLQRVQKSAFEGELSGAALDRLRKGALAEIDPVRDTVRVYHLCGACHPRTEVIGTGVYVPTEEDDVLF